MLATMLHRKWLQNAVYFSKSEAWVEVTGDIGYTGNNRTIEIMESLEGLTTLERFRHCRYCDM